MIFYPLPLISIEVKGHLAFYWELVGSLFGTVFWQRRYSYIIISCALCRPLVNQSELLSGFQIHKQQMYSVSLMKAQFSNLELALQQQPTEFNGAILG